MPTLPTRGHAFLPTAPPPQPLFPAQTQWTSATANGYEFVLVPNELRKVNMAYLTAGFFGVSCLFHLLAVFAGVFEVGWFLYWRCEI